MKKIIVFPNHNFVLFGSDGEIIPNRGDIVEIEGLQYTVRKTVFDYTAKEIRIFVS